MSLNYSNTTKKGSKLLVPTDDGKKNIGEITNRVFTKYNWHSKKHFCYKHSGIGFDKGAFTLYILPLADLIQCPDKDTSILYAVTVEQFQAHLIEDNLGWGPQVFCPIKFWSKEEPNGNGPCQLGLWGGSDVA